MAANWTPVYLPGCWPALGERFVRAWGKSSNVSGLTDQPAAEEGPSAKRHRYAACPLPMLLCFACQKKNDGLTRSTNEASPVATQKKAPSNVNFLRTSTKKMSAPSDVGSKVWAKFGKIYWPAQVSASGLWLGI